MPRMSPDAARSRQRIVDTAAALFREKGYAATSIRDIADRLHVSKAALYYHFASKEEVFDAVISPALDLISDQLDGAQFDTAASRRDALREFVTVLVEVGPQMLHVMSDPAVSARLRERVDRTGLPGKLRDSLAQGAAGPGTGADVLARAQVRAAFVVEGIPAAISMWAGHHRDAVPMDVVDLITSCSAAVLEGEL